MKEMVSWCTIYVSSQLTIYINIKQQDSFVSPYHLNIAVVGAPDVTKILEKHEISTEGIIKALKDLKGSKVTKSDDEGFKYLAR
jgi:hypothetical protein